MQEIRMHHQVAALINQWYDLIKEFKTHIQTRLNVTSRTKKKPTLYIGL